MRRISERHRKTQETQNNILAEETCRESLPQLFIFDLGHRFLRLLWLWTLSIFSIVVTTSWYLECKLIVHSSCRLARMNNVVKLVLSYHYDWLNVLVYLLLWLTLHAPVKKICIYLADFRSEFFKYWNLKRGVLAEQLPLLSVNCILILMALLLYNVCESFEIMNQHSTQFCIEWLITDASCKHERRHTRFEYQFAQNMSKIFPQLKRVIKKISRASLKTFQSQGATSVQLRFKWIFTFLLA